MRTAATRLLLAAVCTSALMALAITGVFLTTVPQWVNLLFEPFSLLLMPGLVVSVLAAGPHDFSPYVVAWVSAGFYFLVFYAWLGWRGRTAAGRSR